MKNRIRLIVSAIIKNKNKILVQKGYDNEKDEEFYRLPGGGIEFGETGSVALKREIVEEFGSKISNVKFLGIIENIFNYKGGK